MRAQLVGALLLGGLAVLAGCASAGDDVQVGARPDVPPSIHPLPPVSVAPAAPPTSAGPAATWVRGADGVARPDPIRTPGAVYPDVDAAMLCELRYIQGVRQPRYNTKVEAFAAYGVSTRERDVYRVDHLVPISLGGSNEVANLWPQPFDAGDVPGAEHKDALERQLRGLVCSGTMTLADAQQAIRSDWWAAYGTSMGLPILPGSDGPETWQPPTTEPGEVVNGAPCETVGAVGYTDPKRVPLTCTAVGFGEQRWQKRS